MLNSIKWVQAYNRFFKKFPKRDEQALIKLVALQLNKPRFDEGTIESITYQLKRKNLTELEQGRGLFIQFMEVCGWPEGHPAFKTIFGDTLSETETEQQLAWELLIEKRKKKADSRRNLFLLLVLLVSGICTYFFWTEILGALALLLLILLFSIGVYVIWFLIRRFLRL